jgi:copper chaperone CopZ
MYRIATRASRWLAPLLGVTLLSGIASAKVITEVWQIKGVHNAADEAKVRDALVKLPSVTSPIVNTSTVRVTFDDQKLQEATLKSTVAQAGGFELMTRMPDHPHGKAPAKAEAKK